MKKILSLLRPIFEFSGFLFPFALVFYLILFLLENVFTGFVSNLFDLNYFLIPIIVFGFLAAFASHQQEQDKPATRWDFILIAGLVVLSFVILVYRTGDLGGTGFVISLISSILILFMSLIFIFPQTEKVEVEATEVSKKEFNILRFNRRKYNYKKIFLSPLGLSLTGLILIIIIGGLVFDLYQGKSAEKKIAIKNRQEANVMRQQRVEIPDKQQLGETPIFIQNGSGKTGKASSMAAFLRDFNFGDVRAGDADSTTYKNAYIKFNEKDLKVASYISFLLTDNDKYRIINMLPPTNASQSGIILILGQ